jgi:RES domain-containing protein
LTPEDRVLDADDLFANQPLILYRLARARYANLSGVGAAQAPGRWNRRGQEAIYTSTEKGVPLLERLAHTPKDLIPSNLALMTIRVSGTGVRTTDAMIDSHTGGCFWFYRTLAHAQMAFTGTPLTSGLGVNPFAVAVPSVIVPVWNVVLYPQAPGFWDHVALEAVERFEFDPRLFPDGTPVETPE